MNSLVKIASTCVAVLVAMASPAMAQEAAAHRLAGSTGGHWRRHRDGRAGLGIGWIGGNAVQSMARQPEVATQAQGAMIVSAALIEGATFFALIVCILQIVL